MEDGKSSPAVRVPAGASVSPGAVSPARARTFLGRKADLLIGPWFVS